MRMFGEKNLDIFKIKYSFLPDFFVRTVTEKLRNTENKVFAAEIFFVSDCKSIMEQCLKYFSYTWTLQNGFYKFQISSLN